MRCLTPCVQAGSIGIKNASLKTTQSGMRCKDMLTHSSLDHLQPGCEPPATRVLPVSSTYRLLFYSWPQRILAKQTNIRGNVVVTYARIAHVVDNVLFVVKYVVAGSQPRWRLRGHCRYSAEICSIANEQHATASPEESALARPLAAPISPCRIAGQCLRMCYCHQPTGT